MSYIHEIREFSDVFGDERGTRKLVSDRELLDRIAHDIEVEGLAATIESLRAHDRKLLESSEMSSFLFDEIYQASFDVLAKPLREWLGSVRARPAWALHFCSISSKEDKTLSVIHFVEKGHLVGAPYDFSELYKDKIVTLSCGAQNMGGYSFLGRGSISRQSVKLCSACAENSKDHYERKNKDATNMLPDFDLVAMKQYIGKERKSEIRQSLLTSTSLANMAPLVDSEIEKYVIDWAASKYTKFTRAHGLRTFYNWGAKGSEMIAPVLAANLQKSDWLTLLNEHREKTLVIEKGANPASHVWENDFQALADSFRQ